MKNKGFTIVELLAAIIILSIVILIAVSSISGVSKAIKTSQRNNIIKNIEVKAANYAFNVNLSNNSEICVNILVKCGYIEPDNEEDEIFDPLNDGILNNYKVRIKKNGNYYTAEFTNNEDNSCENIVCNN